MDPRHSPQSASKYHSRGRIQSSESTLDKCHPDARFGESRSPRSRRHRVALPLGKAASLSYRDPTRGGHDLGRHESRLPPSNGSGESLANHAEGDHPAPSADNICSPVAGTTADFARVSLEQDHDDAVSRRPHRGRGMLSAPLTVASKRSASSDVPGVNQNHKTSSSIPTSQQRAANFMPAKMQKRASHAHRSYQALEQYRDVSAQHQQPRTTFGKAQAKYVAPYHDQLKEETVVHRDYGYGTPSLGKGTVSDPRGHAQSQYVSPTIQDQYDREAVQYHKGVIQLPANGKYPGLVLQPDSSPISQEQLAAEVKGIYAGLVMVEAKCINIDTSQAADPKQPLGPEQWQALIALHRTLLYEHHDFLMATQHPSATQALRGLATKYSMPARMWKHGIHAFLEVLRHRRPESQDYMLAFIYLAYSMMALLFETVPAFTDTWIECLGDLARYRMAIEEDKETHATWGGVAARWYTLASDRHPAIGRLYHHLGILERPSLRKFCLYAKSLTCVIAFSNARDSLTTLCTPQVQEELSGKTTTKLFEVRAVTLHALVSSESDLSLVKRAQSDVLELLPGQTEKLGTCGAYLAILNISQLFQMGMPTNVLFQQYTTAINQAMRQIRPATTTSDSPVHYSPVMSYTTPSAHLKLSEDFWADTFNTLIAKYDANRLQDLLPFIHVTLAHIHSLHSLRARLLNGQPLDTYQSPIDTMRLSWAGLAHFLNTLAQQEQITHRVLECARQGVFLAPELNEDAKPLSEDYLLRGLLWGQFYFSPGWFDGQSEDDGRAIETPTMQTARARRVLWLGVYLAVHTEFIQYDVQSRVFSASSLFATATSGIADGPRQTTNDCLKEHSSNTKSNTTQQHTYAEHTSASSSPSSDDGFTLVKHPKSVPPPPQKRRQDLRMVQVADENSMVWTADDDDEALIRTSYSST